MSPSATDTLRPVPGVWLESTKAGMMSTGVDCLASIPRSRLSIALGDMLAATSIPEGELALVSFFTKTWRALRLAPAARVIVTS